MGCVEKSQFGLVRFGLHFENLVWLCSQNSELVATLFKNYSLENERKVMISCGLFYSLLISYDDSIYAFGYNGCGQLGIGTQDQRFPIKFTQE